MVGPWLHSLWKRGRRLSDIEYLAIKAFDTKLKKNMGAQRTTAGTLATLTASSGKDLYLAVAKINVAYDGSGTPACVIELQLDGTGIETYNYDNSAATAFKQQDSYEFTNIGDKVAATEVIRLEVISVANVKIEGFIKGFEEATGDSPAI